MPIRFAGRHAASEELNKTFDGLVDTVRTCQFCQRMCNSARVFDRAAGPLDASLMFIGEAPGRLGADASGIPFHGDKAGDNFERLLATAGLDRYQSFVTNAVLCNPKDEAGNNAPPSAREVANCSRFLRQQIDLINPSIVVTLGAKALDALALISPHELTLAGAVRSRVDWYGRILVPLYHPGQRAMIHRSYTKQLSDYYFVAETLKRASKQRSTRPGTTRADTKQVLGLLFKKKPMLSYFSLHKLFYLVEYHHLRRTGWRTSNTYIIRQKDGPYCVDLHVSKLLKAFPTLKTKKVHNGLVLDASKLTQADLLNPAAEFDSPNAEISETVDYVIQTYSHLSEVKLKSAVYLTSPMRRILREEIHGGRNMLNAPIVFDS